MEYSGLSEVEYDSIVGETDGSVMDDNVMGTVDEAKEEDGSSTGVVMIGENMLVRELVTSDGIIDSALEETLLVTTGLNTEETGGDTSMLDVIMNAEISSDELGIEGVGE